LKKNICSISGQGSSKHERIGDDNYMDNHIKGHVSSGLQSMFSYQPEKEEEVAPESIVQGHFLHPEIGMDSQCEKVFQSIFSSLENDIMVKFLINIDMDEGYEISSMEVFGNKETNDIDEVVYAICPSEAQKDNEEVVVLFKSFENQDFENPSMGALDCEVVHEQELISIYSLESQSGCPQTNFQKFNETTSELFDEQEDNLGAYYMAIIFEYVQ
jgi:hypothetical protein